VGEIQFGAFFIKDGSEVTIWRHLACVGSKPIENVVKGLPFGKGLQGYADLSSQDREKVKHFFESRSAPLLSDGADDIRSAASGGTSVKAKRLSSGSMTQHRTYSFGIKSTHDRRAKNPKILIFEAEIRIAEAEVHVAETRLKLEKARKLVVESKFAADRDKAASNGMYGDAQQVSDLEIMELAILEADVKVAEAEVRLANAGCNLETTKRSVLTKKFTLNGETE